MIPLLITMDLEIAYDHNIKEQKLILLKLFDELNRIKLPLTIFSTSEAANLFKDELQSLQYSKHEIGCHGLDHSYKENYKKMSRNEIVNNLTTASKNIENIILEKPVCFRGPSMSTSSTTQEVLIANGYKADFSICSQRMDILNSKGGVVRWLFAPRLPYHPSKRNPYRKGDMPIWVVPLSSIGIPFISGILYLFKLRFMKFIFRLLYNEAKKTSKPIVYLFHSYEFTKYLGTTKENDQEKIITKQKRPLHQSLYMSNPEQRYQMNIDLFKYMLSFDSVLPMTGKEYVEHLNKKIN